MRDIHQILKQYWGYSGFRPNQKDVIGSILAGKDTLALMPTGGGKSLCYQVPAMAMHGTCLVISPLIALMKDQVEGLRKKHITAFAIFSGMTRKEVMHTLQLVTESNCKFLYVSPERLETSLFKEFLPGMNITLIAVDEAHCISQWGYDFRPSYLRIANLREELPEVPILALTASATPEVQIDITDKLSTSESNKKKWSIFRQSFERPNLSYSTFQVDSRINKMLEVIRNVTGTGIVYCKSRKRTKEISDLLNLHQISADFYHAGLDQEQRSQKQEAWIENKIRVIVCTNAFGMGIDKPDVRFVIHADVPDCLENYYQEAGRGGRDGKKSYAVLLYDDQELDELEERIAMRFPSLEEIRIVYQGVANYLQLAAGTGEGNSFEFELTDFVQKFNLNSFTTLYALKALEQDGWLAFNEQFFQPATVQFNATKEYLYAFERDNPALEPLIKTLLRTYEGIFDQPSFISELLLAQLLRRDKEEIRVQLESLDRKGLIHYQPRKDSPQLYFLRNRIRTEDLVIDMVAYRERKARYIERSRKMVSFVRETVECRSLVIGRYFGDKAMRECGICDNCLRKKSEQFTKEEFESIHKRIQTLAGNQRMEIKDLLEKMKGVRKEKAWKVIEFLQSEDKLEMFPDGGFRLK